ncbi:putative ribonuclease H-like domain-containing protein [Tanacetum coccineum]
MSSPWELVLHLKLSHNESFSDEDEPEVDLGNITNSYTIPTTPNTRIHKDHPIDNVIDDVKSYVQTRRMIKPTSEQGFLNDHAIKNIQQDHPTGKQARLVAQGHRQEEGIDYEEVFALVARIEAIRLFLAYASFIGFLLQLNAAKLKLMLLGLNYNSRIYLSGLRQFNSAIQFAAAEEVPQDEAKHEESVPTPSNDPQPSGEDSLQLTDLMVLCTKLQTQVLNLHKAKDAQAKEIAALKKRIQRLERRKMSIPTGLKRLRKVGMSRRVKSFEDQESLGAPEDAFKQGRSIEDIDADVDVSLVDETQEKQDDDLMFDTGVWEDDEMHVEAKVDGKDE